MRLFIALPISKKIQDEISKVIKQINKSGHNIRFVPDYNWHFTLVFLGEKTDEILPYVKAAIEKTTYKFESPIVRLDNIAYGPLTNKPRMIWVKSDQKSNIVMSKIKKTLVTNLENEKVDWKKNNYKFNGHITLARFRPTFVNDLPKIETKINIEYKPLGIKLIKSTLTSSGAKYKTIFEKKF